MVAPVCSSTLWYAGRSRLCASRQVTRPRRHFSTASLGLLFLAARYGLRTSRLPGVVMARHDATGSAAYLLLSVQRIAH